jgi:serine/threonine protein kinase
VSNYLRDRVIAAVGEHFLIEAELGRGGMAAVFRALDLRLNRRVAIKVLPPELAFNEAVRSRFMREAQMSARLTHPNIVPIYTVDEKDGLVYFAMALVEGDSIATLLSASGRLPVDDVRAIIADVADALDYAHRQGVVHRDIKPDNIIIDRATRRPMVTDFGIARAAAEEQRLTVTGMAVGTPAYMSPEQAMGEREVDGRSDIYSLGIVAYQMLAGETPFKATNTPSMLMKHVSEPPPPLLSRRPDAPKDLARAVERSLAKRPEDRWRSGAEMREAVLGRIEVRHVEPQPAPEPRYAPAVPVYAPVPMQQPQQRPPAEAFSPWTMVPPPGLSRSEMRDWKRDRKRMLRDAIKFGYQVPERSVDEKISRFRITLVRNVSLSFMLLGINAATGGFPWFIFPALAMGVQILNRLGSLWGDGVPLRRILFGSTRPENRAAMPPVESAPRALPADPTVGLVPQEVLHGPHGSAIRRAGASRQIVMDLISRMTPNERAMLPADLENTVRALIDRVVSVGTTLHRLDADANGSSLGSLDQRLVYLKAEPPTPERERRVALLERQRSTLGDLMLRRSALLSQFESATVALENLKLDLVRFRSAGVSSALEDVSSATREARAVSRDIDTMLDAADEVRRL